MKIVIFGAGAVGGYIGGRLAQAGRDVTFIARGAHLEAIRRHGLRIQSISGDVHIDPAQATDDPGSVGTADLVICCVKSWQVREAARQLEPMLGPDSGIITIQNGVEAHTTLAESLGGTAVLPGLCKMISLVEAPGVVAHKGIDPYLAFGDTDGSLSRRLDEFAQLFVGVRGLTVNTSADILEELWLKFMIIAPWSGMGAVTRSPIGVFRRLPETRELLCASTREVFEVARAHGIGLAAEAVDDTIAFIDKAPEQGTASMQRDIMEGKPSELHEQSGAVVRLGAEKGVATPVNRFIYHSLLPLEQKARGTISF